MNLTDITINDCITKITKEGGYNPPMLFEKHGYEHVRLNIPRHENLVLVSLLNNNNHIVPLAYRGKATLIGLKRTSKDIQLGQIELTYIQETRKTVAGGSYNLVERHDLSGYFGCTIYSEFEPTLSIDVTQMFRLYDVDDHQDAQDEITRRIEGGPNGITRQWKRIAQGLDDWINIPGSAEGKMNKRPSPFLYRDRNLFLCICCLELAEELGIHRIDIAQGDRSVEELQQSLKNPTNLSRRDRFYANMALFLKSSSNNYQFNTS